MRIAPFDDDGNRKSKSGKNYLTVNYERLIPLLIEAIKEQQIIIDHQNEKIIELNNKFEKISTLLENFKID